ncbi:MAG: response regulator [Tepidisphaeraceae bacterium]
MVEDAMIIREPLTRLLAAEGFEVFAAADGREAMAHLSEHAADLILLDVLMPRMDGVAFLSALRADPLLRHLPVIGLTGISDTSRLSRLRELGVVTILYKVRFTFDGLVEEIRRHLGERVPA